MSIENMELSCVTVHYKVCPYLPECRFT